MAANTRSRKRKRSTSSSQSRAEPEEPSAKFTRTDLMCSPMIKSSLPLPPHSPICFDLFNEVYSTLCGHSFCFQCISLALRQNQQCPVCKTPLPVQNPILPNCSLNDVVAKFVMQSTAGRAAAKGSHRVEDLLRMTVDLTPEELKHLLKGIEDRSRHNDKQEQQAKKAVMRRFLEKGMQNKEKELERVKMELAELYKDHERLEGSPSTTEPTEESSQQVSAEEEIQAVVPSASPLSDSQSLSSTSVLGSSEDDAWMGLVAKRSLRVEANFEELLDDYFNTKLPRVGEVPPGEESLAKFTEDLHKFTQYQSFRELSGLAYGDQTASCCIVSSIEFDRDGEFFAVAGVTKKIKVFEYRSVVRNVGFTNHFPVHEMTCGAKLSCVAYNPYHKHSLVSSDYEGCVCVWDTNIGRRVTLHQEHGRRVWSVAYNPLEPTLFASGSDDCTVKLWSANQLNSIFSFSAKANICSVKFNPHSRYLLAYGSADHEVHYVDLRKPNQPLLELRGHKKAVSYVHFMGPHELVSASTDSELKLWDTERGMCTRTYSGHVNDKNFVGLTVTPDFIACGSENNAVYVYSKQVSRPMLTYQYSTARGILPTSAAGDSQPEPNEFVSAVCWMKGSSVLLAANSQGHIKVLEMC